MAIEIKNVSKSFGDKVVLNHFSCSLPIGQPTCLMGPSGAGKTTFLLILSGLLSPDSGNLGIIPSMRKSVIFQENRLCDNLTALTNVRLITGKTLPDSQIQKALLAVGLDEKSIRQPCRELSGGMRRRVALVRALLAPYDILLMDEPFKGLDTDTKALVITYCKAQTLGKTVLMITHDEDEATSMGGSLLHLDHAATHSRQKE